MGPDRKAVLYTVLTVLACAVFVRVWGLWDWWLNPDEAMILSISCRETLSDLFNAAGRQAHPPLHYLILRSVLALTSNLFVLRLTSLIPALVAVVVAYYFCRRAIGTAAGVAAAMIVSFGYGPLILSQVTRPYALLGLIITGMLWSFVSFMNMRGAPALAVYSALASLALVLHYSASIAVAALGIAGLLTLIVIRATAPEFIRWLAGHIVPAIILLAFYWGHLSDISASREVWTAGYLAPGFFDGPAGLWENARSVFYFCFHRPVYHLFAILFLIGLYSLWVKGRKSLSVAVIIVFILNIVLAVWHKYPFIGSRHAFFLFPFVMVSCAAGISIIGDFAVSVVGRKRALYTGCGIAVAASLLISFYYSSENLLRGYGPVAKNEFALTRESYLGALHYLKENAGHEDTIITTEQTADYIAFDTGDCDEMELGEGTYKVTYEGMDFYYVKIFWSFRSREDFEQVFARMDSIIPLSEDGTVFVFNVGYGNALLEEALARFLEEHTARVEKAEAEGAVVFLVPGQLAEKAAENSRKLLPSP